MNMGTPAVGSLRIARDAVTAGVMRAAEEIHERPSATAAAVAVAVAVAEAIVQSIDGGSDRTESENTAEAHPGSAITTLQDGKVGGALVTVPKPLQRKTGTVMKGGSTALP